MSPCLLVLRRVRFRQKTPLSGLYWRFSKLRSQLTYCRFRHHDYSSSHRVLLPFCFPDSHPLKIQGSSSTKSLERSKRIPKPPLISVFKGALRSFLSNNLSFGYNFLPSVICCQRTLASSAKEASIFGTCKLIRIYLSALKSWYNATGPRCHAFVDSFSNLAYSSEE